MDRHYSFGTADLVALMAAHRVTMEQRDLRFDQCLVHRLRAALEAPIDPPTRDPAIERATMPYLAETVSSCDLKRDAFAHDPALRC